MPKGKIFIQLNCPHCKNDFSIERWNLNRKKSKGYKNIFCSRVCYSKFKVINPQVFICKICGIEIINDKGYKTRVVCSNECRFKNLIGSKGNLGYKYPKDKIKRGEGTPNWQGGKTTLNERIRRSQEFKDWRKAVFERDKYTCVLCGIRGGELNADHIKPFAHFYELRFELANGRTLCVSCHRKTDTYGGRARRSKRNIIKKTTTGNK